MCPAFGDLFKALDLVGNEADRMTPHLQDQIAESCFDCGVCLQGCPHAPGIESAQSDGPGVDIPSLMIRHRAMARESGLQSIRRRFGDEWSVWRSAARRIAQRVPRATRSEPTNFREWFLGRPRVRSTKAQARVVFSPSCALEVDELRIGVDAVKVFEHNGVECSLADHGARCGCELLRIGDIGGYTRIASRHVREMSRAIELGNDIVVLSPRCLEVMRTRYPQFVGGPETARVMANMHGPAEYLMLLRDRQLLDVHFTGEHPEAVEYQASCPARNTGEATASEALMRLAGMRVARRDQCCGGTGCRDGVAPGASTGGEVHPIRLLARAYGIATE
jgi:Fe-S oxidoreductase